MMECWNDGMLEKGGSLHYSIIPTFHHSIPKRSVGHPAAKEVGMGNPAEKTTGHPTKSMITERSPALASDFFEKF